MVQGKEGGRGKGKEEREGGERGSIVSSSSVVPYLLVGMS